MKSSGIACIGVLPRSIWILVGPHIQLASLGSISNTIPFSSSQAAIPSNSIASVSSPPAGIAPTKLPVKILAPIGSPAASAQ